MDRLTSPRVNGIKTGFWSPKTKEEVVQRLGAYEDTGLTPEEIKEIRWLKTANDAGGWIRPEDRTPPLAERILIARVKDPGEPLVVEQATRLPGDWYKVFGANVRQIVAWMPMPQPPQIGGDNT